MNGRDIQQLTVDHAIPAITRFAGRQRELAAIEKQYEIARDGNIRVMALVGALGIGKTRLLDETEARALQDGAIVLRGGASELEGMPPYLPFLEALGRYIRVAPLAQLRAHAAIVLQTLATILPELADRLGDLPVVRPLPPEQARLRLYEAIGTFLETMSVSHVLVVMFDDLHYADNASLDLLCYLAHHQPKARLLFLCAYRDGEIERNTALSRTIVELTRLRTLTALAIEPLLFEDIAILASCITGDPLNPPAYQFLYAQSEGNPFFAEELLWGWMEEDGFVAWDSDHHVLPRSIVGVLQQHFARLSPPALEHLQVAAVIGRSFDLVLLAQIEDQPAEDIEESLLEAVRMRLLRIDQEGDYTFSHGKIRECLYAEMSASRRRRLHEVIGQTLETRFEQGASSYLTAKLAFHFAQSGDRERSSIYAQPEEEELTLPVPVGPGADGKLAASLTRGETRVLRLVVQGKSNRSIAQELGISEKTVANHLTHILYKTRSGNRAAAAAFAVRHGLV